MQGALLPWGPGRQLGQPWWFPCPTQGSMCVTWSASHRALPRSVPFALINQKE